MPGRTQAGSLACSIALGGCASFETVPPERTSLFQRMQTHEATGLTVSVAIPTAEETRQIFGVPLEDEGIQPVCLRIVNRSDDYFLFLPAALDPDYFSPQEAT